MACPVLWNSIYHSPGQKRSRARSRPQMPVPQDAVPELQMPVPQEIDLAVPEVTLPKGTRYVSDNFKQEFSIGSLRANCLHLAAYKLPGPTSFQMLRTVNGTTHESYRDECLALGLLEDDNIWVSRNTGNDRKRPETTGNDRKRSETT